MKKDIIYLLIICYLLIYFYYIYPLYNLSLIHDKEDIKYITNNLILGYNDKGKLYEITNIKKNEISFFYLYSFFKTKKYTIWYIFNRHNKFTDNGNILIYFYNKENNTTESDILNIDFKKLKTFSKDNIIYIQYLDNYKHEINFVNNTMKISISTNKNKLNMILSIDDYNTTMPPFLHRYRLLNNIIPIARASETQSPNEWCSDNPLIGKIIGGEFNSDKIESNGNYWFDHFIGANNFFMSEYYWFVIFDDDWLIYILFYCKYEDINLTDSMKVLYIKNIKENKIIHCSPGKVPFYYKPLDDLIHPIDIKFKSNIKFGDKKYDDYEIQFESNDIQINIKSIKNKSVRTLSYDYYKDNKLDRSKIVRKWDNKYIDVLNNLTYAEYVNRVDVKIKYNNKIESFETDQIVDAIYPIDKNLPTNIRY